MTLLDSLLLGRVPASLVPRFYHGLDRHSIFALVYARWRHELVLAEGAKRS